MSPLVISILNGVKKNFPISEWKYSVASWSWDVRQKEWRVDNEVIYNPSTQDQKIVIDAFGIIHLTSCIYMHFVKFLKI